MFGNLKSKVSAGGFKPQDFKRTERESSPPPQRRERSEHHHHHSSTTVSIDLNSLFEGFYRWKDYKERRRRCDQEINLDILGLAKICDGVISIPDVMIHLALDRRQARARMERFLAHGYCRVVDQIEGEDLYLFESLLPESKNCHYCGTLYRKDSAPSECHNCGAPN